MRRLGSQRQLGIVLCEGMRLCRGNRPAPFDRTIAVSAHLAPVDAEERAFSSFDLRERALAKDRDELLAERPSSGCSNKPVPYGRARNPYTRAAARADSRKPTAPARSGQARTGPAGIGSAAGVKGLELRDPENRRSGSMSMALERLQ